ncbi:MAG TPA: 1-acyl-sn-glycerol-3-phosphate acyltransferase, partial [Spirochaetota bacterium]
DEIGEVWLKGASVFAGYYKNEKATNDAFDDEGYFNTGDIGKLDKDGDLFLTGRKKNTIVLDSGKNVYPDEVEAHLKSSNLIADVAVFGKKITGKETVVAVIVPVAKGINCYAEIKTIVSELNRALPSYKRVSKVALSYDPLPKNSTRKTLMEDVKNLFDRGAFQMEEDSVPEFHLELTGKGAKDEAIISLLKQRLDVEKLFANQTIRDFNLDSLELIELISHFEESLGISIDEKKMMTIETLEELTAYLAGCPDKIKGGIDDQILRSTIDRYPRTFYNPFNEVFVFIIKMISRLFWDFSVFNQENLLTENAIIAANHQSYLDILWIYSLIPRRHRKDVFITGKREVRFFKLFFWGAPIIFIEREGNVIPALKGSADVLRNGKSLIIFPEGTRTMNGDLGHFKNGTAYLSKNLNIKVIPVTIRGGFDILPRRKLIPRFFSGIKGSIVIGKMILPEDYHTIDELNSAIRNEISRNLS